MARELVALWAAVTTTVESVLGRLPSDSLCLEVATELATKFQKAGDHHSWHEWPAVRIYDLLLGPPPSQAWLADRLDEAVRQLRVELATRREDNTELEALRTLPVRVWDSVLGGADGSSSLAASLSAAAELFEG
jgi:hypothetical protein